MTFVYGDPVLERREQVWERLTCFSTIRNGLWFMIGDFNEITNHNEKTEGRQRPDSSFLPFRQMLSDCGKRARGATVRCRLDRAVGNEDWWLDNVELRQVILDGWKSPGLPQNASIMEHISSCRKALGEWRRQHNLNSAKQVEELKEKVESLYSNDDATTEEITEALKELADALKAEEMFWKQKSRDEEGLVAIATSYFRQIFESSNPEDIEEVLSEVSTTITRSINDDRTAPVTEWEVKLALFTMHPEKAPGPDGMTAIFYQKFWDIRLRKVLPDRILETQSAFVAGRQISDNIMIAQEMFHALRTKPSGRNKRMAIKKDMSKAYDRMEWSFIEAVMRKMGFSEVWIIWIMRCITMAEPRECEEVMEVVRKYEKASGQCINFDKSSLLFGKRVGANLRQQIKDKLGIQNEGGMGTYLGIPEDISGSKCKLFAFLKKKLMHRVNGWTGRWMSKGGKEVLIKSILLALPTYVMSTFLLPLEICENLASAIAQFWWRKNPPKRGIHWAKWKKMCLPREEGGIGFRMIHEFNLALLAKQLWLLVQFPDSLVARVLRGKYYRMSSPLRLHSVSSPSYVWTNISVARKLLLLGIRKKIHSEYEVKVWENPWIPTTPTRPARPIAPILHPNLRVSDLINGETREWDDGLLEMYVNPDDITFIKSLAISSTHHRDSFCWNYTRNGQYTVKSGYRVARNLMRNDEEKEILEPNITKLQAFVWKVKAPQKMCHLMWQLLTGQVAVTRNLVRQNMRCDNYCPRCGEPEETATHAIFECPPALQVWKNDIAVPELDRDLYPWIIWYIWKARNDKIFRGIDRDPIELVRYAESECQAWFNANERAPGTPQELQNEESQVICLDNICMVDGSWTSMAQFSGCGWVWKDSLGQIQLMGMRNLSRRKAALHLEVEALWWAMESMLLHSSCQSFGTDCKDLIAMIREPQDWPSFATELEAIKTLQLCFPDFKISYIPRAQNGISD
ncbi:PREDICTED: uncharacterized protein LOC106331160 [Brassica oleracea var. oleracea]|uniref:uncharacterized protein LOC106331160 n=1 Tax=Brassica oleracea var. oleracea TaxID=109376 RepID=UPI0006A6DF60|nr:PREDICTED: uncharacterized protein LOC106331160 [Brassica oleracea var. oleracea]